MIARSHCRIQPRSITWPTNHSLKHYGGFIQRAHMTIILYVPNGHMNTLNILELQTIRFGVGVVVFGLCTWLLFDEVVTLKLLLVL